MPLVSVVIGTFNHADFLRTAIESVLSQTFQDFEIIVVDDASQDHTCKMIHDFHEKKIRYIKHDVNKEIAAVRNIGLLNSKGKYIGFLDDDDEWLPKKLQVQVELLERRHTKVGAVCSGYLTVNRTTGEIVKQCLPSQVRARVEHVFGHQVMAMGGKLIRTIGLIRARAKIELKNLSYNLQRFLRLSPSGRSQLA